MKRTSKWKIHFTATILALAMTAAAPAVPAAQAADSVPEPELTGSPAGEGGFRFSDIQFLSGTTGRAAGNGFMVGTSDAGASWQTIYEGTWQFSQMDFISNTTGWALAKSAANGPNALIYTQDGGSTFTKIKTGSMYLKRIEFTDSLNGFGYSFAYAYRTADGGHTWTKINTPANTRYAEFTDKQNGWALVVAPGYGYKLYRTVDGGAHWTQKLAVGSEETTGGEIYTDGDQVWALVNGGAGMSQQSYSLYASLDNGSSWRKVISQETAGGGAAPGSISGVVQEGPASPGGHPGNMQLTDGAAILAGYSPAAGQIGVGRSLDGGKSWTNMPTIEGYESVISFTDANLGWIANTSSVGPAIYSTSDGGKTWVKKLQIGNQE